MAQAQYMSMLDRASKLYYLNEYTLETQFNPVPAVYVFIRLEDQFWGNPRRTVIYVGQTGNLPNRLSDHEKWACVQRHGANRICILQCPSEFDRRRIEADFIELYQPPCNIQGRNGGYRNFLS